MQTKLSESTFLIVLFLNLDTRHLYFPTFVILNHTKEAQPILRMVTTRYISICSLIETHFLISTCKQSPELCTQIANNSTNKELKNNHVGCTKHVWLHLYIWKSVRNKLAINVQLLKAYQPYPLKHSSLIYEQNQRKEIQVIRHMVAFSPCVIREKLQEFPDITK